MYVDEWTIILKVGAKELNFRFLNIDYRPSSWREDEKYENRISDWAAKFCSTIGDALVLGRK